jgi:hypothetical protein
MPRSFDQPKHRPHGGDRQPWSVSIHRPIQPQGRGFLMMPGYMPGLLRSQTQGARLVYKRMDFNPEQEGCTYFFRE